MTTIRIPLRWKSQQCNPMQHTYYHVDEFKAFDPDMDDEKALLKRFAFIDREPEIEHLDRASSFWAGIHWYRDMQERRQV